MDYPRASLHYTYEKPELNIYNKKKPLTFALTLHCLHNGRRRWGSGDDIR